MKKFYYAVLMVLAGFIFGCSDNEETPLSAQLKIDPATDIVFDAAGGVKTITVTTDQQTWQAVSDQAWCVVAQVDATRFTVTADKNENETPMPQAVVTVTAGAGDTAVSVVLKVDQRGEGQVPPVTETTFKITLGEPTAVTVGMTVEPSDDEALYYYDVLPKDILKEHHSDDLAVYMKNMMAEAVKNFGTVERALEKLATQGKQTYEFSKLSPSTDYWAFAAGLDDKGEVNTEIAAVEFRTLDLTTDEVTFDVQFFNQSYDGIDFTITPSDDDFPYYYCTRPAFAYSNMTDDELLETILIEDSFMLGYYAAPGVQEYESEGVCATDTEYWVLLFGYADYAPTTGIKKFPFRTSKSATAPETCTFEVMPERITSRSLDVTIVPSDETVMYMYDLIAAADYEQYKSDMKGYVEAYVDEIGAFELDYERVRGETGYSYNKMLEPGMAYYIWIASIDEFGKVQGEVRLSDKIETLPAVQSEAVVTATIDKYFDGDELYALDAEKYADYKGKAYVPVTFAAEKAAVWYGTLIVEDPDDPTSAISDAEIVNTLVNGGGTWCPTGKLYLCAWNVEHTILAVGVADDENAGALLRMTRTFTKEGAAPVSEFVDPSTQGVRSGRLAVKPYVASVKNYK